MQPYFFPYIGEFQLLNAANTCVIYDDVITSNVVGTAKIEYSLTKRQLHIVYNKNSRTIQVPKGDWWYNEEILLPRYNFIDTCPTEQKKKLFAFVHIITKSS